MAGWNAGSERTNVKYRVNQPLSRGLRIGSASATVASPMEGRTLSAM